MNQRSFSLLAGIIFIIIALLHLVRIIYGWDPVVEGGASLSSNFGKRNIAAL